VTALETDPQSTAPRLSDLDESERNRLFSRLQERMPGVWDAWGHGLENESVVVVPSVTLDPAVPGSGSLSQAFEERLLFLLLLLRQPWLRMIYVTSMPIKPSIIEYYLALLPGVIPSHAMARLNLLPVGDSSSRPLSAKLLDRPRLLSKIAAMIPNRQRCHPIPYNTTGLERDIALTLGIPMYGADPRLAGLGSKTGCRRLFAEEGIQHPLGVEHLYSFEGVTDAIMKMLDERPSIDEVIVKLNEGVSGAGNALVDLRGIADKIDSDRRAEVAQRVRSMQLESATTTISIYEAALEHNGGVVEERIVGVELLSPSVQLRVRPDRSVELLSTHDQLLGGPTGQSYLGCIFPADSAYSRLISAPAMAIGERLAREGALGRFAVDFVVKQDAAGDWSAYAIELNLRKGGTTHPFLTLQFLTDGSYDGASGRFLLPSGEQRHLVATDHLESSELRALAVEDLFDIVARHGLHFDQSRQTGVVFHMISSLTEHGRIGLTAVGQSPEEAMRLYEDAQQVLFTEAAAAREESRLPGVGRPEKEVVDPPQD
jgi:PGM1 C-terminal domain